MALDGEAPDISARSGVAASAAGDSVSGTAAGEAADGIEVFLNVYDVTNAPNPTSNTAISRLNAVTRELGLGGVFHGAVMIGPLEYAFGYCERGTGVYHCKACKNPMYVFRETLPLGRTQLTQQLINELLVQLKADWPGPSYDLLTRNCCHFCEDMAKRLGVAPVPAWLNRFAQGADATIRYTNEAVSLMRGIGAELGRVSGETVTYFREQWVRTFNAQQQQQQQWQNTPGQGVDPVAANWDGLAADPAAAAAAGGSWGGSTGSSGSDRSSLDSSGAGGGSTTQQQPPQQQGRREQTPAARFAGLQQAGSSLFAQARQRLSRPNSAVNLPAEATTPPASTSSPGSPAVAAAARQAPAAAAGGNSSFAGLLVSKQPVLATPPEQQLPQRQPQQQQPDLLL